MKMGKVVTETRQTKDGISVEIKYKQGNGISGLIPEVIKALEAKLDELSVTLSNIDSITVGDVVHNGPIDLLELIIKDVELKTKSGEIHKIENFLYAPGCLSSNYIEHSFII